MAEHSMDRSLSRAERRGLRIRTALPWLAGLTGVVALVAWGTGALRPTLDARDVRTARVTRGDLETTLTASGTIVPAEEEVVSSPVEARVLRVRRRAGEIVTQGEPLLTLDVSAARLALQQLDARIDQSSNEAREAEADLAEALLDLRTRRDIEALAVESQRYALRRNEQLFDEGLVAEVLVQQSRVDLRKAELELRRLEESLRIRQRFREAQANRLASQLGTLRAERAQASRQLELATTLAPRSGVLTFIVDEEGATVRKGDVLARIADLDSFRVEGSVADLHAARIEEGQPIIVPLDDRRLRGRIARVLPAIDAGRLRFEAALDEPAHGALRASLRVDVQVVTSRRDDVLTVPRGAFLNGSGSHPVFVVEGAEAHRRLVEIGASGAEGWEVVSGLSEGDEIVVSDVSSIRHLNAVRWRREK